MDDRDFMDMMYAGMAKTTHAEDGYWGFEEKSNEGFVEGYSLFAVTGPDNPKILLGVVNSEEDAAFITAVHGSFPDIYRRWLAALDEADQKDLEKDMAESVAADLSERLAACERNYARTEVTEEWHGQAT